LAPKTSIQSPCLSRDFVWLINDVQPSNILEATRLMEFTQMRELARAVRAKYVVMEAQRYGRRWTAEEIMLDFVGDVGDLAKLIQDQAGFDRPSAASASSLTSREASVNLAR
jgi:hypothetical protein